MASVLIDSQPGARIIPFVAPLVERKAVWSDDWEADPELELVGVDLHASSSQVDSCHLTRRYGNVKAPYESDFATRVAVDYRGHWIRVSFVGGDGLGGDRNGGQPIVHFMGTIDGQSANLMGTDTDPAGVQEFVASGGLRLLERLVVSEALFLDEPGGAGIRVQWVPAMNARDEDGFLVGNRSADKSTLNTYLYDGGGRTGGASETWTHYQYVTYLVKNFLWQGEDGPMWTVTGQTDVLDGMVTTIKFPEVATMRELLQHLIPLKYALDYTVRPTEIGFEIRVFALNHFDEAIAGVTLPSNPKTVEINKSNQIDLVEAHIVESTERKVDRVRVLGKRIVVCGSLKAANALGAGSTPSLVGKWPAALETAYLAADDAGRREAQFESVYQDYGAPADWDPTDAGWNIQSDLAGSLTGATAGAGGGGGQNAVRATLHWLPLKTNVDYTTSPPTDSTPAGQEAELLRPMAWVYDTNPLSPAGGVAPPAGYVQAHLDGCHVLRPKFDWGIRLEATPNHLLAAGLWSTADSATTATAPRLDATQLVATIAIESDHRLQLGYDVPEELAAGDGSVMTILEDQAEAWVLLAGTAVGDSAGHLQFAPGFTVLRNDKDRLALCLAGAMARYINERVKARFVWKGHFPWGDMLGSILTVYQQGDLQTRIGAPITGIQWKMGKSPETVVTTGYA